MKAKAENKGKAVMIILMLLVYGMWTYALSPKRYLGPCIDGKKASFTRMQQANEIGN